MTVEMLQDARLPEYPNLKASLRPKHGNTFLPQHQLLEKGNTYGIQPNSMAQILIDLKLAKKV